VHLNKSDQSSPAKASRKEIKSFRSDRGGGYINIQFKKYLEESEIQLKVSPAYSPS